MAIRRPNLSSGSQRLLLPIIGIGLLVIALVFIISAFERIPIEGTALGIDWHGLWTNIQNGQITYSNNRASALLNPPWTALMMLPLGFLSFRVSWGLLSLITLAVMIFSVPRTPVRSKQPYLIAILLLTVSWPSLRQLADGNLEGLIIGGACLIIAALRKNNIWWLAAGILLITAKVQESWLLLIAAGIYLLMNWPIKRWGSAALLTLVVVVPTMLWLGQIWLQTLVTMPSTDLIVFMNWQATLNRIGAPGWLALIGWIAILGITGYIGWISRRTFDRQKAGALIAASLLLAPYAAGNSILTVLAIGVIPLFQIRPRWGLILILLCNAPILMPAAFQVQYGADFATLTTLILWGALCWDVLHRAQTEQSLTASSRQITPANVSPNS